MAHGDELFNQYFSSGKCLIQKNNEETQLCELVTDNLDGDRQYREQLKRKYKKEKDSSSHLAMNTSLSGVKDRVFLDGEFISVPDVTPVEYNVSFQELAVDASAFTGEPLSTSLCIHWINFGVLGGVIFTVGLLAGALLQSLYKQVKPYGSELANVSVYETPTSQDDQCEPSKTAMV